MRLPSDLGGELVGPLRRRQHPIHHRYPSHGRSLQHRPKNLTAANEPITWNALNQPIAMNGTTATYDAPRLFARMVETGSGGNYQQFVFTPDSNLYAIYNAGTSTLIKGTVPLPAGDTAIYNSGGLSYLRHTDWLGSSRLATTWAHAVYSKTAYAPFGETYNEAGTADRSFTGQDQDVVSGSGTTGAYDFLFRKHDPSAGRWLSPDPYGWGAVDQTNPQTLNRYAYVGNQPMNSIDPNGEWWCVAPAFQSTEGGYDATQGGLTCYSDDDGAYIASNPGALLYNGVIYTYSGWNASTGATGLTVAGYYFSVSSVDSTSTPGTTLPFCVQNSCPSAPQTASGGGASHSDWWYMWHAATDDWTADKQTCHDLNA